MRDLSLHLLDIVENSIRAKATLVHIKVIEDITHNQLVISIMDNGMGMTDEVAHHVMDPFVTTRTTRKVGLGLPLLSRNCHLSGGELLIKSKVGEGTLVKAIMQYDHIDRLPLGDLACSLCVLIEANPTVDFVYDHCYEDKTFTLDTRTIKEMLEDVPINELEIIEWLRQYVTCNLQDIRN